MDRRSFLATGATVRAAAAHRSSRIRRRHDKAGSGDAQAQRSCSRTSSRSASAMSPELASSLGLDKGPNAALKSKLDTDPRRSRAARTSPATAAQSPSSMRSALRRLSDAGQAQPRSRPLFARDRDRGAVALGHRFRAAALSDHAAGRRLFLDPRLPQHRAHDQQCRRRRGLSLAPQPVRDRARQRHRRAARAGRARLPRAGLVDRPDARPDAQAAQCRRPSRTRWSIRSCGGPRQGHRRRLASARAAAIVAKQRLSRARPPDRGDGAAEADHAVPATAHGA